MSYLPNNCQSRTSMAMTSIATTTCWPRRSMCMNSVRSRSHKHRWRQYGRDADDTRSDQRSIPFDRLNCSQETNPGHRHHQATHLPLLAKSKTYQSVEALDFPDVGGKNCFDYIDFHKIFRLVEARHQTSPTPEMKMRRPYHGFSVGQVESSESQLKVFQHSSVALVAPHVPPVRQDRGARLPVVVVRPARRLI